MIFFSRPCFLLIGNIEFYSQYNTTLIQLAKNLFQESKCHIAYFDTSSIKQIELNQILLNYYNNDIDKKLLVRKKESFHLILFIFC